MKLNTVTLSKSIKCRGMSGWELPLCRFVKLSSPATCKSQDGEKLQSDQQMINVFSSFQEFISLRTGFLTLISRSLCYDH